MKPALEGKLRELIEEAGREGAPAMYAVLHMLHGAYLNGEQNKFAQHCCQYSPIRTIEMTATRSDGIDEPLSDSGKYYH